MTLEVPTYVFAASAHALLGLTLGLAYRTFAPLRDQPWVHLATVFVSFAAALVVLAGSDLELARTSHIYSLGVQGFLFLAASLCHLPVLVYIALHHWHRLLEHLTSPGDRRLPRRQQLNARAAWKLVQLHLEALAKNPLSTHHRQQLAEVYLRLGFLDSAIGEYRKAVECMERGYAQAQILFKLTRLLVERKQDIPTAMPVLRRIVRLYPRSYFAAYARRVVNHYEAHQALDRRL
jgi:tetratricopeptide (TPR) repeat protein